MLFKFNPILGVLDVFSMLLKKKVDEERKKKTKEEYEKQMHFVKEELLKGNAMKKNQDIYRKQILSQRKWNGDLIGKGDDYSKLEKKRRNTFRCGSESSKNHHKSTFEEKNYRNSLLVH
jgi:hypothetical protein